MPPYQKARYITPLPALYQKSGYITPLPALYKKSGYITPLPALHQKSGYITPLPALYQKSGYITPLPALSTELSPMEIIKPNTEAGLQNLFSTPAIAQIYRPETQNLPLHPPDPLHMIKT
jgi:hypothetical protein